MTEPSRIRATAADGKANVRVLMTHEMESGQRKDEQGRPVPAWHIRDVTAQLNGRTVLTLRWGPSVSRNPYLQFTVRGAKAGDRIAIAWVDNRGDERRDEALVT